ncbi:testis-expressed protein 13D [Bos taurus]|uniref:testis-expressed protein 13D n=1 Tax=Bos taurus TaxID=9913 RepID=UPI0000EBE5E2|nr:testis-expressed protein 13D [Bos taurus]
MAVDFGDNASGFRHVDVIRFINNEVLENGGGPDFYMALRSRPWNEVEDQLQIVVADPRVPHAIKRACAWSALALSVRVGARQREQQAHHIRQLQQQVREHKAASWALANELKRLHEEREQAAAHGNALFALKQVMYERDMLRGRLLQFERAAQLAPVAHEMLPGPGAEQLGATAWPLNVPEHGKMVALGAQGMPHSESQMAAPAAVVYVPGPQSSFAQAVQPLPPMLVPHPFPCHESFPSGYPYVTPLPPVAVMEEGAVMAAAVPVAVAPQVPPLGIYPLGQWAAVGAQEEMAPPYDPSFYAQEEYSENLQGEYAQEACRSHSREEGAVCPQGMSSLRDSRSHSQEEGAVCPQGMSSLRDSRSQSQEEGAVCPQEMSSVGGCRSQSQEEGAVCPQEMSSLRDSRSQSQEEGAVCPQGMSSVGGRRSHSREEGAVCPQEMSSLQDSRSQSLAEGADCPQMSSVGGSRSQSQEEGAVCPQGMSSVGGRRSHSREEGAVCPQEMSSLQDSRSQSLEEGAVCPQGMSSVGGSRSHSQEEGAVCPQGMSSVGASRSHSQEEDAVCPQGMFSLGGSRSHSREKGAVCPQGMSSLCDSRSQSREEGAVCPQGTVPQGDSRNHSQEGGPVCSQGTAPHGDSRSHSQKECPVMPQEKYSMSSSKFPKQEGPERPQGTCPSWYSKCYIVRKSSRKQEQNAKQPKEKNSSDTQHQQKPTIHPNQNCWECLRCKAVNFPWRKSCYKCKNVCRAFESGGLDPGQAH